MGLDACVYCNCYEKGVMRTPPPNGVRLCVEPNGALECESEKMSFDAVRAFDQWQAFSACQHKRGVLLHHRLGNISLIGSLRSELQAESSRFPVLLTKVIYSGSHAGDFLALDAISVLQQELEALGHFQCSTAESAEFMTRFGAQM